jgi:diguanylate cyclase
LEKLKMACRIEEKINEKGYIDKKDLELIYEIVRRQLKFMIKYNILMIPKNFSILFRIFCNIIENNRNVSERDILAMYKADLNDLDMVQINEKLLEFESRKDIADKLELIAEEIDEKILQILEVMNLHQENIAKHENIIKEMKIQNF